eukprot:12014215-Ditylum_brightwellii.AAC.1
MVQEYKVGTEGIYAVVRRFEEQPAPSMSIFVQHGTLINKLYLFSVETILSDVAVVPEMDLN